MSSRIERYTKWGGSIGENIDFGTKDSALHVLMALVVDDGVSTRGHRKNTFSEKFKLCGVGVAPHKGYGTNYVFDFAGATGEGAESAGGGAAAGSGEEIPYDFASDPDKPADCIGVNISVSTKTSGNQTIKTTTKTYTLKGGGTQTVTQTETTTRS